MNLLIQIVLCVDEHAAKIGFYLVYRSGQFFKQDSQRLQLLRFGLSPAVD